MTPLFFDRRAYIGTYVRTYTCRVNRERPECENLAVQTSYEKLKIWEEKEEAGTNTREWA